MFLTSESNLEENPFHIAIFIELIMNTVPRQKGFGEADKVYVFDVLSPNPKCRDLCITDTSMFYDQTSFLLIFLGKLRNTVRDPASMLEAWPPC